MPNLGPFAAAIKSAIKPTLESIIKNAEKSADTALEQHINPIAGELVQKVTDGRGHYVPPSGLTSAGRELRDADLQVTQGAIDYHKDLVDETAGKLIDRTLPQEAKGSRTVQERADYKSREGEAHPLEELESQMRALRNAENLRKSRMDTAPLLPSIEWNKVGSREWHDTWDPNNERNPLLSPDRLLSPQNQAETMANLDLISRITKGLGHIVPDAAIKQLPPAAQGVWHLLNGRGRPTDFGLTERAVRRNPSLLAKLGERNIAGVYTGEEYFNFANAAEKLKAHWPDGFPYGYHELRPATGLGIFANSVGRCFLVENHEGGWDLVDDYRFYDHVEREFAAGQPIQGPLNELKQRELDESFANNWRGAGEIVKGVTGTKISGALIRPVRVLQELAVASKNKALLKAVSKLSLQLEDLDSFDTNTAAISYVIDKMLERHGTPYPVVIKNFDRLKALGVLHENGFELSDTEAFEKAVKKIRNDFSHYKTLSQLAEEQASNAVSYQRYLDHHKLNEDYSPFNEADHVTPLQASMIDTAVKYGLKGLKGDSNQQELKRWLLHVLKFAADGEQVPARYLSGDMLRQMIPDYEYRSAFVDNANIPVNLNDDVYEVLKNVLDKYGIEHKVEPTVRGELHESRDRTPNGRQASLSGLEQATIAHGYKSGVWDPVKGDTTVITPNAIARYFESLPEVEKQKLRNLSRVIPPILDSQWTYSRPSKLRRALDTGSGEPNSRTQHAALYALDRVHKESIDKWGRAKNKARTLLEQTPEYKKFLKERTDQVDNPAGFSFEREWAANKPSIPGPMVVFADKLAELTSGLSEEQKQLVIDAVEHAHNWESLSDNFFTLAGDVGTPGLTDAGAKQIEKIPELFNSSIYDNLDADYIPVGEDAAPFVSTYDNFIQYFKSLL